MSNIFYGKYRGTVKDIDDPLKIGRIRANVPEVFGEDLSGWALPCAPFGGEVTGFFAIPAKEARVWIEFQHGDPDYPIWSGCWWDSAAEMPPVLLELPYEKVMLRTKGGHSILLDDTPGIGGITLETSSGQKIVLNSTGVEITNGQGASIKMVGLQVSINDGALEVM